MTRLNVHLSPLALKEIDQLPGYIRQRVRRAILGLPANPFPPGSKQLTTNLGNQRLLLRIQMDRWRILYVIDPSNEQILVIAVRQRPPYQYEDLDALLSALD